MSFTPPSPTCASGAVVRFALSVALVGWLWLAGSVAMAEPSAGAEPPAGPAPSAEPSAEPPPPDSSQPAGAPELDSPDASPTMDAADELDGAAALSVPSDDDDVAARRHAASQFHRELRAVEEEVSQLKERVFRSKATLSLLKELVVDAAASGSRIMLWHVNDLGGGYVLESAQYFLDGKNVYTNIAPDGSLDDIEELKFHEQTLPPGEHNLQVNLVLRGKGSKIFSYLESFQFKVQSSFVFNIEEGMVSLIRVVIDSRGSFKNFEDRPSIRYDERKHVYREGDEVGALDAPSRRRRAPSRERPDEPDGARSEEDDDVE